MLLRKVLLFVPKEGSCIWAFLVPDNCSPLRAKPDERDDLYFCFRDVDTLFVAALETPEERVKRLGPSFTAGFGTLSLYKAAWSLSAGFSRQSCDGLLSLLHPCSYPCLYPWQRFLRRYVLTCVVRFSCNPGLDRPGIAFETFELRTWLRRGLLLLASIRARCEWFLACELIDLVSN